MTSLPRFRIFISSPRDVGSERALAMRVLERLQLEFRGRVELSPIFWEHEVLKATDTFQSQIPRAADADICIFILWSWFGTPLPADFRRPDGTTYRSGTEFEFEDAIGSFQKNGSPDVLVYRKTADVAMPTRDRARELEWRAQRDALFEFVDRWFRGEGGSFKAAFHEFERQQQFEDLLEAHLRRWIEGKLRASPENAVAPEEALWKGSPYRGLERFDFDHALIYCGRTQAVAEAIDALRRLAERGTPFLLVAGMSGAGKSSFARAGILPMLVQPRVIEGDIVWRWAALRPGDVPEAPLESVAAALLSDGALPELAEGGVTRADLARMLGERADAVLPLLSLALARAASTRSGRPAESAKLVLIADQLDEIFTQALVTTETRNAFANALAVLARSGKVWVIATLRSDLFARMAELPSTFSELARGDGFYELRAPSPAEVGQMIRRPARIAGVTFERRADTDEGLDDVLRDAAAAQPASLPLLEFALDEMLKSCTQTKLLTFAAYEALGGLEGALRARAEDTFTTLGAPAQAALSPVIARLVQVRLDGAIGQMRAQKEALDAIAGASELVDAFVAARLFVVDRGADGKPVVGVAHEALLREWPRVSGWIEENRAFLNVRARVAAAQALWTAADRSEPNLLPSGRLLQEAEALLSQRRELLSEQEVAFVEASLQRAARERRGRQLRWAAAAALVLVIAGGAVVYWDFYVRDHARYFSWITKRWGVFYGVYPLAEEQVRARQASWRFHTRGRYGPVYRMVAVNSAGTCPMTNQMSLYIGDDLSKWNFTSRRPCTWEFEIDANRWARAEHAFDFMGRPVYSFRYSDKDATTAEYYTPEGYAASGARSGASRVTFERIQSGPHAGLEVVQRFRDAYGRPKHNHQRVYGMRLEYDDHGQIARSTHLDRDDQPMANTDGIVGSVSTYDEHGNALSWSIVAADGGPARALTGVSSVENEYDGVGNLMRRRFRDLDGSPVAWVGGFAETRFTYDKRGNVELETYWDAAGRPTRAWRGESKVRRSYDQRGWLLEETYLDENDQPVFTNRRASKERYAYDAESNRVLVQSFDAKGALYSQVARTYQDGLLVREVYLDASDRPVARDGHSGISMAYRNGLEIERTYLDATGRAVRSAQKFAKQRTSYDERGNSIEVAYLDEQGRPTTTDGGYATIKRQFNEFGDAEEEVYLGLDGGPVNHGGLGYARIRRQFDRAGRATEVRFFKADGEPVWPKDDCSFRRSYDVWGRESVTFCIDDRGNPAPHPDGKWTRKEIVRNAVGNPIREEYQYGAPASDRPRLGRIERAFDPWGNALHQRQFDESGAPLQGSGVCHHVARQYNRAKDVTEEACFDASGNPAARSDGAHRVVLHYDDRGRVLYRTFQVLRRPADWPTSSVRQYLDEQNRLRRVEFVSETDVVRLRRDYDERRRVIKTEYFDGEGRPELSPGGFAKSRVLAFDDFGGADMAFEDEQGRPVEPAILVTGVKDGGPGARAGVRRNDVILRYDGKRIHFGIFAAAQRALAGAAGAMRELVVLRDDAPVTMQVEPVPLQLDIEPVRRPAAEAGGR